MEADSRTDLQDAVSEGAPSSRENLLWETLSIGWHVLVNLFMLALAYAIFASVTTRFETIVISILAVMWAANRSALSVVVHLHRERLLPDSQRYCHLLELLKDPEYLSEPAKERTRMDHIELAAKLSRAERTTLIYEFGWGALFLLAMYKLIVAVSPALAAFTG